MACCYELMGHPGRHPPHTGLSSLPLDREEHRGQERGAACPSSPGWEGAVRGLPQRGWHRGCSAPDRPAVLPPTARGAAGLPHVARPLATPESGHTCARLIFLRGLTSRRNDHLPGISKPSLQRCGEQEFEPFQAWLSLLQIPNAALAAGKRQRRDRRQ